LENSRTLLTFYVEKLKEISNKYCKHVHVELSLLLVYLLSLGSYKTGGRRGGDRMVVGFTTTCTISAYHH